MTRSPMPPGSRGRRCGGYVGRRSRVLPRETCPWVVDLFSQRLAMPRGVVRSGQESAEAIVAALHGGEGPNMRSGTCTRRSMHEEDAGTKAEKPERSLSVGGGTAEGRGTERQAGTARDDYAGEGARAPEPQVLPVNRRIGNGTSGGVGGQGLRGPTLPACPAAECSSGPLGVVHEH